jgi:hemoglobin
MEQLGHTTAASHFAQLGGQPTVDRIVDEFYRRMDTLPEAQTIRAMHPANLADTKHVLKLYLAEWLGGPHAYSEQRGHPRLRARHLPFRIGVAERDAWLLCMRGAMESAVADKMLLEHLMNLLFRTADWMRNDADGV